MEHRRVRRRGVAGEDRGDDARVLGVRARNAPLGAELGAAERREAPAQPAAKSASTALWAPG